MLLKYFQIKSTVTLILFKKIFFYTLRYLGIKHKKYSTEYGDVYLDFQNDGISQQLFYYKTRETDKVNLIKNILKSGDGIVDCGSNIGVYPVLASNLVGNEGYVACIEPDPRNVLTLKKNFNLINSKKDLIEKGIGNRNYTAQINLNKKTNISRLYSIKNPYKELGGFTKKNIIDVEIINFQDLLKFINFDLKKIKLLRMDIEGGENEVLDSVSKCLDQVPNIQILFETHPDFYSEDKLKKIIDPFFNKGYKFKKIISSGSFEEVFLKKFDLKVSKKLFSDGFKRYLFENVSNDVGIQIMNHKKPKLVRYVLLAK